MINTLAPDFTTTAFHNNTEKTITLSSYRGKWVVLAFYPADFTFVCPTELKELTDAYPEFQQANCEVLSVSTDTVFVHKAWHDASPTIKKIQFPMIADPTREICTNYGTLIQEQGLSWRATFIINPSGIIKWYELHDNSIGRNTQEIIRKLHAAQYVASHPGEVCPASWTTGKQTLRPGLELVGKI